MVDGKHRSRKRPVALEGHNEETYRNRWQHEATQREGIPRRMATFEHLGCPNLDPRAEGTHQLELLSAGVDDPDLVAVDDGIVQRARGVRGPANFALIHLIANASPILRSDRGTDPARWRLLARDHLHLYWAEELLKAALLTLARAIRAMPRRVCRAFRNARVTRLAGLADRRGSPTCRQHGRQERG